MTNDNDVDHHLICNNLAILSGKVLYHVNLSQGDSFFLALF